MEDKNLNIIKYIKYIIIFAITIVLVIIIYSFIVKQINIKHFDSFLKNNNYKIQDDGTFIKESNNTRYIAFFEDSLISKQVAIESNFDYINILLKYKTNDSIEIDFKLDGINKYGKAGLLHQKGTYKNGEFICNIISGEGFETKCDLMQKESKKFNKEIDQILKENHINPKYIKSKNNDSH